MLSILEDSNPDDAKLLQAFGSKYSNLADRDRARSQESWREVSDFD